MLTPGARLGPYEVVGSLGKGGMGEVYRAKDTKLGREVALKVIPDELARNAERMARFEREARVLAALHHPHIAGIYGLEETGTRRALVMEVAEGATLRERLAQGPVPLDEALDTARQIAEALEYAHEKGIVHRDLKPSNVKVTPEGDVKLLDFGLARAYAGDAEEERDFSESPTISQQRTAAGVILGTAAYMSPEQARGKAVDRRADIWSFGVLLLELLTGRPTFSGDSVTDVLAAVVRSEPDFDAVPGDTPPAVRRLLRRCLDKDPRQRLRDMGEARIVLESPGEEAEELLLVEARGTKTPKGRILLVAALLAVVAAAAGFVAGRATAPNPLDALTSTRLTFRRGSLAGARFAPDGKTVMYSAAWDGQPFELYSVRSDVRESRSLGMRGAGLLAVSSAGEVAVSLGFRNTIGFEQAGMLARMPLGSAAPREVLEGVGEADWSPDGQTLAVTRDVGGRRRLEYPIGTVIYETGAWLSHPRISPDERSIAFVEHFVRGDNRGVLAVSLDGEAVQVLAPAASNGIAWAPSGREILVASGGLLRAVDLSGASRLLYREVSAFDVHDVAGDGSVLLSRSTDKREMVGRGPGAAEEQNLSWLDWSFPTMISDDGRMVAFEEQNFITESGNYALFIRPTDGSPPVRLGDGTLFGEMPDGRLFGVAGDGGSNEMTLVPTGAGEVEHLGPLEFRTSALSVAPGGRTVVFAGHNAEQGSRLYVKELPDGTPRAFSPEGVTAYFCQLLSPDGSRAFATSPGGTLTVYPLDDGDAHEIPRTSSDDLPIRWAPDGRSIFVQSRAGLPARIERIDVETGERQLIRELMPPDPAGIVAIRPIHLSADGESYVYSYKRLLAGLYILSGLR